MKKTFFLLIILMTLGLLSVQAQFIHISGYVTDETNGNAVPNHEVYIMDNDSLGIYTVATTNDNGYYFDTIPTGGAVINSLYVYTNDLCTFGIHDTLLQNPGPQVMADFQICVDSVPGNDCQAYFYYQPDSSNQSLIHFYDASQSTFSVNSWYWDFGDGATSTIQNPVHVYPANGSYTVCLTISADSGSCTSTYCKVVVITNGGGNDCEADFYYVQDSANSLAVNFFDQSLPVNGITSWSWDFGDGGTSSQQDPVHTYNQAGTYDVCLSIESQSQGVVCYDTYCMDVVVNNGGPNCQAYFYHFPDSNAVTNTVYFYDYSIPAGMIDSWFWNFGDGSTSSEQNPVHTYASAGTYNACLTITADSASCTSVYCDTVVISVNGQLQLGGNVFAGIYQLDQGFAYAYKSENGVITDVYSDFIDTLGYYLFYPLVAADYYVKVEPSPNSAYYNNYMPTYYGDVVTWEDAVLINLSQNIYTADINLVPMNQAAFGPGQISGTIVHSTTLRDNTPAEGVQIMLANGGGEFVGLAYSDEEGRFAFTDLAYGTFTLYAEVMGINMVPGEFTLTEDNSQIADISMIMTDDEIYFGPSSIETLDDISVSEIYPNPVSGILKMEIGAMDPTTVTLRIVNQLGQLIRTEQLNILQGQTVSLNTSDLQQGMYFLEVVTKNNFRTTRRFVKL